MGFIWRSYDATKKLTGWDKGSYNDKRLGKPIAPEITALTNLIASDGAQVRKIQEIKPVRVFRTPKGSLVADMGQNMVGWLRLNVKGPKGTVVRLRHAEVLDKYGEFYTTNLRAAKCELDYTLAGTGEEIYEPRFTFHGIQVCRGDWFSRRAYNRESHRNCRAFRYARYRQLRVFKSSAEPAAAQYSMGPEEAILSMCLQIALSATNDWAGQAMPRPSAGQLPSIWTFRHFLPSGSGMLQLISDRVEKCRMLSRMSSILREAYVIQPSAGWGDVAVIAPWTMYLVYGDKGLLRNQYPSMKAWVDYIKKKAGNDYIWKGGSKYGDWLFYHPPVNNHPEPDGYTEHDFIATAYYAYSTGILAAAARVLGNTEDEVQYSAIFNKIKEVFVKEYVTAAGRVGTDSQTSYVLALMFNLLPKDLRAKSAAFLVDDIRSRDNHLSTGFLGTIYLCHVLTACGYTDVAYDLLLQESYPSWLYPVKMGATTIWERWDGQKTDSTFQDPGMNSFNHYAYGAIGDWMYRVSAGIETKDPGYKHLILQPHPTKKLSYSRATFESSYGSVASGWERNGNRISIRVTVPPNCTATVVIPADAVVKVTESGKSLEGNKTFSDVKAENGNVMLDTGSGNYTFEYTED